MRRRAHRGQGERPVESADASGQTVATLGAEEARRVLGDLRAGAADPRAQLGRGRRLGPDRQHAVALDIGDEPAVLEHRLEQDFQVTIDEVDRRRRVDALGDRRVPLGVGDDAGAHAAVDPGPPLRAFAHVPPRVSIRIHRLVACAPAPALTIDRTAGQMPQRA